MTFQGRPAHTHTQTHTCAASSTHSKLRPWGLLLLVLLAVVWLLITHCPRPVCMSVSLLKHSPKPLQPTFPGAGLGLLCGQGNRDTSATSHPVGARIGEGEDCPEHGAF